LAEILDQVGILTGTQRLPTKAIVLWRWEVLISCVRAQCEVSSDALKAMIKRRSALVSAIGRYATHEDSLRKHLLFDRTGC